MTVNDVFNCFIDQVKGEIEVWSERGSGWVVEGILAAFVNVARYEAFRGGSYFPLPEKLQNKKVIINVHNKDKQCLRWVLRASGPSSDEKPSATIHDLYMKTDAVLLADVC